MNEHDGRKGTWNGTHSLSCGVIREPNVAFSAVWVLERFGVVLLERGFRRIHHIAGYASSAEEIWRTMDGVQVLWPMATYVDEQG